MVPIKTSIEDMQKLLGYLGRQVSWVEVSKIEKSLGTTALDNRKVSAMTELGLIIRDSSNLKLTDRGRMFLSDRTKALTEAIQSFDLYRATIEWFHYQNKSEVTAVEVGHYWESTHSDTLDGLGGPTLKDGAVCFGRVVEGAGLGKFLIGRGGKETRLEIDKASVDAFVDSKEVGEAPKEEDPTSPSASNNDSTGADSHGKQSVEHEVSQQTPVTVSTSPNVHVNVEIHIAANATADTVKEIFRNMARYVLDKQVDNDKL